MRRIFVGLCALVGTLAVAAGCGGNSGKVEAGTKPADSSVATTTTLRDSYVCTQHAESPLPWGDESMEDPPCPTPSTLPLREEEALCFEKIKERKCSYDIEGMNELSNALTSEKIYYTDTQSYTDDYEALRAIEPWVGWGTKVNVVVSDDKHTVCITRTNEKGDVLSIADIATERMSTRYSRSACPAPLTNLPDDFGVAW